jgi:hypothetical protein
MIQATPPMTGYEFAPDACDVVSQERLISYRSKRTEWLRLLDGDPLHSVSQQLSAMQWNDVAYRCFNEARRFASPSDPRAAIAPMLGEFLDIGYISTQVLAISKILERNPPNPQKAVISLRRIVDDLAAHRSLLTREIFISYDGLPYNPEPARERWFAAMASKPQPQFGWVATKGPEGWGTVDTMHTLFDRLSGIAPVARSRDDLIRTDVFDAMLDGLKQPTFSALLELRHKAVAHAADENNRPRDLAQTSLNQILTAHRILVKIAHTVAGTILAEGGAGGLPTPQFDQFEHLDHYFIRPADADVLQTFWNDQARERDEWLLHADSEILDGRPPN